MADVCPHSSSPSASWKTHHAAQEWENRFPSPIKEMMGYCITDKILNRRSGKVKFKNFKSSVPCHVDGGPCDRMVVCVPYCGTHVHWEVIFSYLEPTLPPDLVFSQSDFNPDIDRLTVLSEWNPEDPSMLALLLQQVMEQFVAHCSEALSRHQRLQFELHTLEETEQYSKVEVLSLPTEESKDEPDTVFYVPLVLDLKGLPEIGPEESWKDDAVLVVKLSPPNASHVQASVLLTPQLEKVIGVVSSLSLPVWGTDCNPCLMDYVPLVHRGLQDKVDTIHRAFEARREYVAMWLSAHEKAVLEYDTEGFSFVSFLFETKGFYALVHFELTRGFPVEAPIITVRSVYHKLDNLPCESQMKHYHFSSQWSAEEMMEKTKKRLTEILPKFKELSVVQGECLT